MTKTLRKEIVHRKWKISITKGGNIIIGQIIKKQNNFCVNLLRQIRKDYFQSLSGNIQFWKTIKPFFTSKGLNSNKILLKENRNLV